jgi:hypothetical protein
MMKLDRRQYMKLSLATIGLLAASMMDPVSMVSALLEEPETFRLPDRRMEAQFYPEKKLILYPVILGKAKDGLPVGTRVYLYGERIEDKQEWLVLDGRRLTIRDYPELAQLVKEVKL